MLLAVLTCQSATETAQRHWPSWIKHFDDIVFVTPIDSNSWVPEGVEEWKAGRDYYPDRDKPDDNLPKRTMECLKRFLCTSHDSLMLIEYDVVLFRKPPFEVKEFSGTMFPEFIHSPWMFTRECAEEFLRVGELVLEHGAISGGWPDRHLKLLCDIIKPWIHANNNYSRNTLDQPGMIEDAKFAIKLGAFAVHGVKDQSTFDALMSCVSQ